MLFQINPSFTKKNQLKLDLNKNILDHNFKLCFSLVYSIKSITGAHITKQIGRYYELSVEKNTILFSPAGASFDNFKNFEERGFYFNQTIKKYLNAK